MGRFLFGCLSLKIPVSHSIGEAAAVFVVVNVLLAIFGAGTAWTALLSRCRQ